MRNARYALVLLALTAGPLQGQEDKEAKGQKSEVLKERTSLTKHVVSIDGQKVEYEATAGTLLLKQEDGKTTASFFYVAYTKNGQDLAKRPIMFCFNGGPGAASVWLHLGALGPKRVLLSDQGEALPPPARLVANEWSILDRTDLVFIDPVSTGYSRAADAKDAKQFHGVDEDVQSVGEFIRLYTTRHKRWASPKYLAGESYGTTRAATLVNHLQSRHGMYFNGVLLISTVLNFQTLRAEDGNELPYALYLPSFTATAWHHKKLDTPLLANRRDALAEAERFAEGEYNLALMKGSRLTDAERRAVAQKLARLTGLSEEYILRSDLRIEAARFMRELLRDRGLVVGRFDSRMTGHDDDDVSERPGYDPSFAAVQGPFTGAMNQYLRDELNFESDAPYEVLTGRVQPWNYGQAGTNRYLNVAPALRDALIRNPSLRVFVASGYCDLATPYFATTYTMDHLGAARSLGERVTRTYYPAGHMMYTHQPSLRQLRVDIAEFLDQSDPAADKAAKEPK